MGLMVTTGGSMGLRRFTAQASVLCYLLLALAGTWHYHHHADVGCAAGCPTHHDHRSCEPPGHADGSSGEIVAQGSDCPLCIWSSSARVRQEIVDLADRQLILLGIRQADLNDPVTTSCFLSRQSRAPPGNDTDSCCT